jgi:hypothetical protein
MDDSAIEGLACSEGAEKREGGCSSWSRINAALNSHAALRIGAARHAWHKLLQIHC